MSSEKSQTAWRDAWSKTPFLVSCWISYLATLLIGGGIYYLVAPRLLEMGSTLPTYLSPHSLFLTLFTFFYAVLGGGLLLITLTALTGVDLLYPHGKKSITVTLLFPLATAIIRIIGGSKESLRTSFVKVNNALTIAQRKRISSGKIMILLPHCVQIDICERKITTEVDNCVKCGRCPVGELLILGDEYKLKLVIANGGTLARKRVAEYRPTAIVAVACERDLTYGILDVYPIPVFGVLNDRPEGPCCNTTVDMTMVEEAIQFFQDAER